MDVPRLYEICQDSEKPLFLIRKVSGLLGPSSIGLMSDAEYELQVVEDSSNEFFCIMKSSSHFY